MKLAFICYIDLWHLIKYVNSANLVVLYYFSQYAYLKNKDFKLWQILLEASLE